VNYSQQKRFFELEGKERSGCSTTLNSISPTIVLCSSAIGICSSLNTTGSSWAEAGVVWWSTGSVRDVCLVIVEHEKIDRVTYPPEWCPRQLKAAAMAVLDLQAEVLRSGYIIVDVYPWNVLFRRGAPVFVNPGAMWQSSDYSARGDVSRHHRGYGNFETDSVVGRRRKPPTSC
jgi:hypothetical protein